MTPQRPLPGQPGPARRRCPSAPAEGAAAAVASRGPLSLRAAAPALPEQKRKRRRRVRSGCGAAAGRGESGGVQGAAGSAGAAAVPDAGPGERGSGWTRAAAGVWQRPARSVFPPGRSCRLGSGAASRPTPRSPAAPSTELGARRMAGPGVPGRATCAGAGPLGLGLGCADLRCSGIESAARPAQRG